MPCDAVATTAISITVPVMEMFQNEKFRNALSKFLNEEVSIGKVVDMQVTGTRVVVKLTGGYSLEIKEGIVVFRGLKNQEKIVKKVEGFLKSLNGLYMQQKVVEKIKKVSKVEKQKRTRNGSVAMRIDI